MVPFADQKILVNEPFANNKDEFLVVDDGEDFSFNPLWLQNGLILGKFSLNASLMNWLYRVSTLVSTLCRTMSISPARFAAIVCVLKIFLSHSNLRFPL